MEKRFEQFISQVQTKKFVAISESELSELIGSSQIIFEKDTSLRDYIRIFKTENQFILQETTNKGEIIIRIFENEDEAIQFANDRLQIYDKMWDGCGCKIDYYE